MSTQQEEQRFMDHSGQMCSLHEGTSLDNISNQDQFLGME